MKESIKKRLVVSVFTAMGAGLIGAVYATSFPNDINGKLMALVIGIVLLFLVIQATEKG